jgi:hypothetical protein
MDRKSLLLLGVGCVLVVVVAAWRSEDPVAPPRPLQLSAATSTAAPAVTRTESAKAVKPAGSRVTPSGKTNNKPEPRRTVRVEPRAEVAPAKAVVALSAPERVAPAAPLMNYERQVADAVTLGAEDSDRGARRLEQLVAAEPARPEAYEALAAIRLRQRDYYQAGEMLESALRTGGKAAFTIMHDHTRGNFESTPDATCSGAFTILADSVTFEGADGHRFAAEWNDVRNAGSNKFFGSGIGGFHVAINVEGKYKNFNLAPQSRDKAEGRLILELLEASTRRGDRGK